MSEKLFTSTCSQLFKSAIWNVVPVPGKTILIIETRDEATRKVFFSAFDYQQNRFLWQDIALSETWWVTLCGVHLGVVILKVFESTDNPDKTSFRGLSVSDGKPVAVEASSIERKDEDVIRPHQYISGEADFEIVCQFIGRKLDIIALLGAEYLEWDKYIFISYYKGSPASYVNCFSVFDLEGKLLLNEEIGTNLIGIGWNTFFIVSGHLFFVKNKTELVTFRIV